MCREITTLTIVMSLLMFTGILQVPTTAFFLRRRRRAVFLPHVTPARQQQRNDNESLDKPADAKTRRARTLCLDSREMDQRAKCDPRRGSGVTHAAARRSERTNIKGIFIRIFSRW